MKKLCLIILISFFLCPLHQALAVEKNTNPRQQLIENQAKVKQNFSNFSNSEKTEAEQLLEKAVSMLSLEEESALRTLIKKASNDVNNLTQAEFEKMSELQTKAFKMLPKQEYEKLMLYGAMVVE